MAGEPLNLCVERPCGLPRSQGGAVEVTGGIAQVVVAQGQTGALR